MDKGDGCYTAKKSKPMIQRKREESKCREGTVKNYNVEDGLTIVHGVHGETTICHKSSIVLN